MDSKEGRLLLKNYASTQTKNNSIKTEYGHMIPNLMQLPCWMVQWMCGTFLKYRAILVGAYKPH
jgi:hypothetical protein